MAKRQGIFTINDGRTKFVDNGGYKVTNDAVWLANMVTAKKGGSVLDVGCGTGGVALCILENNKELKVTGIDISERMISDAKQNAEQNGRNIELIKADIFSWKTSRQFDFVVTNPPYFSGTPRSDNAHHNVDMYKWTMACVKRLRARGVFYCIISPENLDKVIAALVTSKCGDIKVRPIATVHGIERIVISGRLGVKTGATMFFPIDICSVKRI